MGQKTNPISNRIGIIRGWDSSWCGNYPERLAEDAKIREYLTARLSKASLSRIVIERTLKLITVTIHTARPGIIIGKGGQEVDKLKEELKKISNKEVQINIFEVKRPELDATIVANNIARQIEGRVSILISGRLGGAEMARRELFKEGRTPLHTFRADIDYALAEAHTKVGVLGIKVWICNGEVYGKRDLSPNVGTAATAAGAGKMHEGRGGRDRRDRRSGSGGGGDRRDGRDRRDRRERSPR